MKLGIVVSMLVLGIATLTNEILVPEFDEAKLMSGAAEVIEGEQQMESLAKTLAEAVNHETGADSPVVLGTEVVSSSNKRGRNRPANDFVCSW